MNVSSLNELNNSYAGFDNKKKSSKTLPSDDCHTLTLTTIDVHNALSSINVRKAAGPDGIP